MRGMDWVRRSRRRRNLLLVVAGASLLAALAGVAANAVGPTGSGRFVDDDGNIHEGNIEAIASAGITVGCNPPANTEYCPEASVSRAQMAAFLVRALGHEDVGDGDLFVDDDGSIFERDIDILGTASITRGCNPPRNDRFCPTAPVTRGELAAFLVRAFGYTDPGAGDLYSDDDDSIFNVDIDKLGTAGITRGCNPPANTRFCPEDVVRRDQMASFLARALGLAPTVPPPGVPPPTTPPTTTTPTTTPPDTGGAPMLIGAGDIASDDPADADTAAIILGYPEATVFTTGDNAYPDGSDEDFALHYEPTWGQFKDRTFPSIGNHDDHTEGAAGYFAYFGAHAGTPGEGWYSYDLANWHIVVLNSECGDAGFAPCSDQEEWLVADLAANGEACMLAYWHKPLFTSGHHEPGSDAMRDEWAILDAAGADVVLNGHDHNYQRYAAQDADGKPTDSGMVEFVVGTGGKDLYDQRITLDNLEEFYVGHGVLRLDLGTDDYAWEFIPTEGDFTDSGTGSC